MSDIPYDSIQYLERNKYIHIWGKKLPHWFQEHKAVFATFRLADSLPQEKIEELKELKKAMIVKENLCNGSNIRKDYSLEVARRIERWIDHGYGSCMLANHDIREIVANAIRFYDKDKYILFAFVIMPNHVHLLLSPLDAISVTDILGRIKSYTAKQINNRLKRTGSVWQNGIFDRIVRDADNFEQYMEYICRNPRNLPSTSYTLYRM